MSQGKKSIIGERSCHRRGRVIVTKTCSSFSSTSSHFQGLFHLDVLYLCILSDLTLIVILPYSSSGLKVSCNIFYKVNDLNQEFMVHININLHRLVKRYLTQWPRDGQVLSGAFFYCSTEGDIEQDRNGLGIVCCKWHHKILSFRVT